MLKVCVLVGLHYIIMCYYYLQGNREDHLLDSSSYEFLFSNIFKLLLRFSLSFYFSASKEFIEARRRSLRRFVNLVSRHPVMCEDKIVVFFLTVKASVCEVLGKKMLVNFI